TLTPDGTTALTAYFPSPDGALVIYALSAHGSDRQELRIRRVATQEDSPDRIAWVKFASVAWTKDASAFFYLRFPEPGSVPPEDEPYYGRIHFHRLGTAQAEDPLAFDTPDQKEVVPLVDVSHSGRWVVVTAQRGASDDADVSIARQSGLTRHGSSGTLERDSWTPVFTRFKAAYHFIEEAGGRLLFRTTDGAPLGRIISVDPARPEDVREMVGETED